MMKLTRVEWIELLCLVLMSVIALGGGLIAESASLALIDLKWDDVIMHGYVAVYYFACLMGMGWTIIRGFQQWNADRERGTVND